MNETEHKKHRKEIIDFQKTVNANKSYSIKQIDYLTIGIPASGIVILYGFLKDFQEEIKAFPLLFGYAIVFFFLSILTSFISHLVAYESNKREGWINKDKLKQLDAMDFTKSEEYHYDRLRYSSKEKKADNAENWVKYLNLGSIVFTIAGMVAAIAFSVVLLG